MLTVALLSLTLYLEWLLGFTYGEHCVLQALSAKSEFRYVLFPIWPIKSSSEKHLELKSCHENSYLFANLTEIGVIWLGYHTTLTWLCPFGLPFTLMPTNSLKGKKFNSLEVCKNNSDLERYYILGGWNNVSKMAKIINYFKNQTLEGVRRVIKKKVGAKKITILIKDWLKCFVRIYFSGSRHNNIIITEYIIFY